MWLYDFLLFFIAINFIAFIHELGHFYFAKKAGVKVLEFGFGFPPRLVGFYKKDGQWQVSWGSKLIETDATVFSICRFPIGAFVNMHSSREQGQEQVQGSDDFDSKSISQRFWILFGGAFFNLIFAAFCFYFIIGSSLWQIYQPSIGGHNFLFFQENRAPLISSVLPDSPAAISGIKPYDIVEKGNGQIFDGSESLKKFIEKNVGQEVLFDVYNYQSKKSSQVKVKLPLQAQEGKGIMGVSFYDVAKLNYGKNIFSKIVSGVAHVINMSVLVFFGLGYMIKTSFLAGSIAPLAQSVAGPVAIYAIARLAIAQSLAEFFSLMALVSLALGVSNILPLPALDGGHLVFLAYEAIFKKKAPIKLQNKINNIGFSLLLLLGIVIIFKDLFQFKEIIFNKP